MRSLSANLTSAQKSATLDAAYKVTLTHASPPGGQAGSYTYYLDNHSATRLLKKILGHEEQLFSGKAQIVLDNSDKALNDIDYEGYTAVLSYGAWISGAGDYSDCAKLKVVDQDYTDAPNDLNIVLYCESEMSLLGHDRASDSVTPADSDTRTVKDWIREVIGDTGKTHLAELNHCTAYDITFDSEDSMIDSYVPKDGYRIYRNSTRLAALRRLLDHTECIARFEDDGELHVLQPTISGASYDYEYKYAVANEHEFFSKRYRESSTVPNYIVVDSLPDATAYQGTASVSEKIGEFRAYFQRALASDSEGDDLAAAILAKFQLHRDIGHTMVPYINAGQEVGDYIKITSSRSGKDRAGNVSVITRNVDPGNTYMALAFGGWSDAKAITALLETYDDNYSAMERLQVKNLYAESIQAENIDLTSVTQDDIGNGTTYGRVLSTHIDAGKIRVSSSTTVDASFTQDMVSNGSTYERVRATQISGGKIELSSTSFLLNEDGVRGGTASNQRVILEAEGLRGYDSSGDPTIVIDATDGSVKLYDWGNLMFYNPTGPAHCGTVGYFSGMMMQAMSGYDLILNAVAGDAYLTSTAGDVNIEASGSGNDVNIGAADDIELTPGTGNSIVHDFIQVGTLAFFSGSPASKDSIAALASQNNVAGSDNCNIMAVAANFTLLWNKIAEYHTALTSYNLV